MKTVHWAMIAAAAYLYYVTSQRKNVNLPPFDPGSGPMTGPGAWDGDTGFVAPNFPHTPTPAWAYSNKVKVAGPNPDPDMTMGRAQYETGMNWPTRDYIFG